MSRQASVRSPSSVGLIGLGVMGRPMARRLLAAGYHLVVHNRSSPSVKELQAAGATAAGCPAEVAARVDCVMTVLPDPLAVAEVVLGRDGVRAGARQGQLFIDLSTSPPALARKIHSELAALDVAALDAPVSGGETGAREGTLTIMVGGDAHAARMGNPILRVLGRRVTHVGPPGAGQVAKAANQVIVGLTIQAVAEALALVQAAGVSPGLVRSALRGGFADSRVLREHGKRMVDGDFTPGAALRLHLKDLRIALGLAKEAEIELRATAALAEQMERLIANGYAEQDHAVLIAGYPPLAGASP